MRALAARLSDELLGSGFRPRPPVPVFPMDGQGPPTPRGSEFGEAASGVEGSVQRPPGVAGDLAAAEERARLDAAAHEEMAQDATAV